MEYLANPFNHSINSPPNDGICGIFNILSLNLFYYIVALFVCKLDEIQREESVLEGESNIKDIPDTVFDNIFDDALVDNQIKQDLIALLDTNSLERHYILYYIFKKRGIFYNGSVDINTFAYYKALLNDWRNIYFVDNKESLIINLDNSLENDYQIVIDNLVYDCNNAHIRCLSWLYYSGIYNYLMDNLEIKLAVLNDMNERKILTGNLFLKYQLLLIDMENMESIEQKENAEKQDSLDTLDNQEKLETIEEECNSEQEYNTDRECNQDENTNLDNDNDDLVEESAIEKSDDDLEEEEENENVDHSADNEEELNNRLIADDFTDMNEMTFAAKLLSTVKNITIRTIVSTWKIIKEETNELFHPVLD